MKSKRLISLILSLALSVSLVQGVSAFSLSEISDYFSVEKYTATTVAPETEFISMSASDSSGKQNVNAIEFNPKNPLLSLRAGKSAGYVYSTQTVNTIANNMSDTDGGATAVAAINGDFFNFGVGVPHGIFIDEGVILSTPPQYYAAFGLTYDNEPFVVRHGTILDIIFRINGTLVPVNGINIEHTKGANSLVLYTDDYARGTKTGTETYELRCLVNSGEVRHGDTVTFTVEEVFDSVGNTALGDGYIVLSAQGTMIDELKKLTVGDFSEITFRFNEFWSNVKFAVGGKELLLQNGEVFSTTDKTKQPRTAIGMREDGSVVMATFDGRQDKAAGMSYESAAKALLALGCRDALNLDGGGSTTFVLRTPGAMKTQVVNSISGSSPRQVANALVLMNTASYKTPKYLSISPSSCLVLKGGEYRLDVVGAYDENYQPHKVESPVSWSVNSSKFDISDDGIFYADSIGSAIVTARAGTAMGNAEVRVISSPDEITTDVKEIYAKPGESFDINASVRSGGEDVLSSNDLFTWEAPETLGFFTAPGKFTVADNSEGGTITVSYGDISTSVSVICEKQEVEEVPEIPKKPPFTITDFEDDNVSFIPCGISTKVKPNSKIETDRSFVYDGVRSFKIYYNFLNTEGAVGSYYMISPESPDTSTYTISDLPAKLGMYVYGDGSGITLRSIIEDANGNQHYISYGKIEHTGWQYMEATLPEMIEGPIYIKVPVNLVSNPEKLTQGCLYFDKLMAVYDDIDADMDITLPKITKAWPSSNMLIYAKTPSLGVIIADNTATETDAGIVPESVEFWVNGYNCQDRDYNAETGKISYTIKNALKPGFHTIKVVARDRAGNTLYREWKFEVR